MTISELRARLNTAIDAGFGERPVYISAPVAGDCENVVSCDNVMLDFRYPAVILFPQ